MTSEKMGMRDVKCSLTNMTQNNHSHSASLHVAFSWWFKKSLYKIFRIIDLCSKSEQVDSREHTLVTHNGISAFIDNKAIGCLAKHSEEMSIWYNLPSLWMILIEIIKVLLQERKLPSFQLYRDFLYFTI